MSGHPQLVLFARYPVAGECKTRLIPAVGQEGAAVVHRKLAARTVQVLKRSGAPVIVATTGADADDFADWLGTGLVYEPQADGDLSDRLLAFANRAPVIFFGSDTPDLSDHHVAEAIAALNSHSVVIGPAHDGGYYLIGMREPLTELLTEMPWSTDRVLPETLLRLAKLGIEPVQLETLSDCDTPEDLARWPDLSA